MKQEPGSAPTISIITVTFNAGSVLEKTLESIFQQVFNDYELIIIDGGSTDDTVQIIEKHSSQIAYWVSEQDRGIYDAMNKGLQASKGTYVQFLNAGDFFVDKDVLQDVFGCMATLPTLIYGDIWVLDVSGSVSYQTAGEFSLRNLQQFGTGVLCHQAMFVLRKSAPTYDCRFRFKAELNWYFDLRAQPEFTCLHVLRPVVYYTLGGFGHKNFIRNRLEWVHLVRQRFGYRVLLKSGLIPFLLRNSVSRYPSLASLAKAVNRIKQKFFGP